MDVWAYVADPIQLARSGNEFSLDTVIVTTPIGPTEDPRVAITVNPASVHPQLWRRQLTEAAVIHYAATGRNLVFLMFQDGPVEKP